MSFPTNPLTTMLFLLLMTLVSTTARSQETLEFQQDLNGYQSAVDTFLQNNFGSGADHPQLAVNLGDGQFSTKNALFLFDEVIGFKSGQIPPGSAIFSATLKLTTTGTADAAGARVNLHRMLMTWDPNAGNLDYGNPPWNDQSWVQADDFEASSVVTDWFTPAELNTTYLLDVTADLQQWVDGTSNFGWVLLTDPGAENPEDVARFHSAESSQTNVRPILIVQFEPQNDVIPPDSFNTLRGVHLVGGLAEVTESDDAYLKYSPGLVVDSSEPPIWIEFTGSLGTDAPSALAVILESSGNTPNIQQTIEVFNWNASQFEQVDFRMTSVHIDSATTVDISADIADYVQVDTGIVKTRLGWRADGPVLLFPWTICMDQVGWIIQ